MALYFLDNVFSLHLALEAPQGILKGFAFLYSNLCQKNTPPNSPNGAVHRIPRFQQKTTRATMIFCENPQPGGEWNSICLSLCKTCLILIWHIGANAGETLPAHPPVLTGV